MSTRGHNVMAYPNKEGQVVPLIVLLLIIAIFGGIGFAIHALWIVLVVAVALWLLGFLFHGGAAVSGAPRRRWYRW